MRYEGDELTLFASAVRWKAYLASEMAPYVRGHVLEVGAGLGATTRALYNERVTTWTCLEPDPALARELSRTLAQPPALARATATVGALASLDADSRFDAILYVDVLEHIERDAEELSRAARHLSPGGHLVVMSPAHAWLMSEFDRAIGHYRRYNRESLRALSPRGTDLVLLRYLDAAGMAASVANRLLLRQALPTPAQIATWDRLLVPISRIVDPWLAHRVGKSILGVWRAR